MKHIIISLILSVIAIYSNGVSAQTIYDEESHAGTIPYVDAAYSSQIIDLYFSLKGGYRVDQLDWSIAGNLGHDYWNVLSELIWQDLKIFQIQFDNETTIKDTFYLRGQLKKGRIYSGSNQDTDYNGNDRSNPWSQSKNACNDGSVSDLTLGVGYIFKPSNSRISFTPLVGFSHHGQDLTITDGYQTISEPILDKQIFPGLEGAFDGLDSSYETNWIGPWLGIDVAYDWKNSNRLAFSFEYHWTHYYAKADWNLISRFEHPKSFEHNANGHGIVFNTNWRSQFYKNWSYNFDLSYQRWQTDSGVDRTFFSDGSVSETRLNKVSWESLAVMFGLSCRF